MISQKILYAPLLTFITFFMSCTPCTSISLLQTKTETPLKLILISNCSITSIPDRRFEESSSLGVIKKLKDAIKSEIEKRGNIEFVKEIDNLGIGSDMFKQSSFLENHYAIDSVISSMHVNDSIKNDIQKINLYICRKGYDCLIDSISGFDLKFSFFEGHSFQKIQSLKTFFDADYCIVNSIQGTVRRKSVSTGEKVGVAVATGLLSLLSPIGGVMVIPGDETEFKSHSFLIDLKTGRVEWMDGYYAWQLRAVEGLDAIYWAQKTFDKFDIKMKLCPEKSSHSGSSDPNPL